MNKKITVIELLNKIANGEEVPNKIKYENEIFEYRKIWEQYVSAESHSKPLLGIISQFNYSGLNDEVEILENNTEEIEELDRELQVGYTEVELAHQLGLIKLKINELVRAYNKSRKEKE